MISLQVTGEPWVTRSEINILCTLLFTWVGRVLMFLFFIWGFITSAVLCPSVTDRVLVLLEHTCYPSSSIFPFRRLLCLLFPTKAEIVVHILMWEGHFDGSQTLQPSLFSHKQVQYTGVWSPRGTKYSGVGEQGWGREKGLLKRKDVFIQIIGAPLKFVFSILEVLTNLGAKGLLLV